ncbi:phytoene dehydrogenase [Bacillus coahuilensis m2-6]|nr:phytoene dehydrogenase [Bacillus coahuilensis m2-6]
MPSTTSKREGDSMYDVIVVGTGFGGLTAGAVLAKKGYRVLTLEAANELGGSAGKFDRNGFRFAAGATVGMGFEQGGVFSKLFEELEVSPPTMSKLDPIMNVYLPDRDVTYYADQDKWYKEAGRVFGQGENIQAFFNEVFSVADRLYPFIDRKVVFPPATMGEWKNIVSSINLHTLSLAPFVTQSVHDRLKKYDLHRNQPFLTFLNGQLMDSVQTTSEYSPSLLGYMALSVFHRGAFYVQGGLASIIETLSDTLLHHGGELKKRTRVDSIQRKANSWEVKTKRGDTFDAKHLIVNAPLHNIFSLLSEEDASSLPVKREKEEQQRSWGAFTLYIGADERFLDDSEAHVPFHQFIGDYEKPLSEGNQFLFSVSHPGDPLFAPPGKRAITLSTHTEPHQWWNRDQYESLKEQYVERIVGQIEKKFPLFSDHIETLLPGTPVTFQRFTQRRKGLVGGYAPTSKYSLLKAYSPNSRLDSLWFCGDTVFPGAGSLGSSLSGWTVASEIQKGR